MQTLRQVAGSLIFAAISVVLVIGGISLALAESFVPEISTPTETEAVIFDLKTPSPTPQIQELFTETNAAPSKTLTPPLYCPLPDNWTRATVQAGDSLETFALRYQSTPDEISEKNCLVSSEISAGSILYVPFVPTLTDEPCGPPTGWVQYTVQAGNTLSSVSHAYATTVQVLQFANCMSTYDYRISIGQRLWVPNVSYTRTPLATATPSLTPVSIIFPTLTHTATQTPTATSTHTSTQTSTPTQTSTSTETPGTDTVTAFPSSTSTP